MIAAQRSLSDGPDGIADTLAVMTRLKDFYGANPAIRSAALVIAGTATNDDQAGEAGNLAKFVRSAVTYQADPVNSEFIQTPDVMLATIHRNGMTYGDCDDHVLLFCSLAESLGIACDAAGVTTPGEDRINHVIAIAHFPGGDVQIDLCAKFGPAPTYANPLIVGG